MQNQDFSGDLLLFFDLSGSEIFGISEFHGRKICHIFNFDGRKLLEKMKFPRKKDGRRAEEKIHA